MLQGALFFLKKWTLVSEESAIARSARWQFFLRFSAGYLGASCGQLVSLLVV